MNCIICQDIGQEPLIDNKYCTCKYKIHNSCWIDYVNSQTKLKCLTCRKDISTSPKTKSALKKPPTASTPLRTNQPSAPYSAPLLQNESNRVPISYQEFTEIVRAATLAHENDNVVIHVSSTGTQTTQSALARNTIIEPAGYHTSCPSPKEFVKEHKKALSILLIIIVLGLLFMGIIFMS